MTQLRLPHPAWILVAGVALAAFGMAQNPATPTGPDPNVWKTSAQPLPAFATADSNGAMIAVTGIDVTGSSLLYLIDTESKALSVYQATGGTSSMRNLTWVGARKIGLDFEVDGYNDKSQYSYKQLAAQFAAREGDGGSVQTTKD